MSGALAGLNDQELDEQLTKSWKAAQGFADQMKREPGKKGEVLESFNKSYEEFKASKREKQAREALVQFEREAEELRRPVDPGIQLKGGLETEDQDRVVSHARFNRSQRIRRLNLTPAQREAHREAFGAYMRGEMDLVRKHTEGLGEITAGKGRRTEKFALIEADESKGGILVPDDFRAELVGDLAIQATFRQAGVRVVSTTRQQVVWPLVKSPADDRYSSTVGGNWRREGEIGTTGGAPPTQDNPVFGGERIPIHIWMPDAIVISPEFFEDSALPVDSVLAELLAEVRALDEDSAFTMGDGIVKPLGILNDSDIAAINSGAANALKYGGILNLWAALRSPYRQTARWMMNSNSYAEILKLESTGGFPLFPPNSLPGTLLMKEVVFNEFMPDVAANATPIIFGAFQYYVIAERLDFRIARLTERYYPNVGIIAMSRVGGKAVRPRAFKKQRVAA
jgi:HK97 family phage major capsid protein